MNIILFEADEISTPLSCMERGDRRAEHILSVLGFSKGDRFDAGIINGKQGKGIIQEITDKELVFRFIAEREGEALYPITLIIGLTRPVHAKRIIRSLSSMGISRIYFCGTEKGEVSYAKSSLWKDRNYRRYLIEGAEQAFTTKLPELCCFESPDQALSALKPADSPDGTALGRPTGPGSAYAGSSAPHDGSHYLGTVVQSRPLLLLDNYWGSESGGGQCGDWEKPVCAIGPERGWSDTERRLFCEAGFAPLKLGERVFSTETASIVVSALCLKQMNIIPIC